MRTTVNLADDVIVELDRLKRERSIDANLLLFTVNIDSPFHAKATR
ncbi:MAG TPA: hypothetical protein VL972_04900 [Solirubrobacteraceae bacterium]|nr:hypothetical protein [Solirubrobacteraceae bacterium]